jgi:hypothetical protein
MQDTKTGKKYSRSGPILVERWNAEKRNEKKKRKLF